MNRAHGLTKNARRSTDALLLGYNRWIGDDSIVGEMIRLTGG